MVPARTSVILVQWAPLNDCHQHLSTGQVPMASCLSRRLSKISTWIQPRVFIQTTTSVLGLGVSDMLCVCFKNSISVSWSPLALLSIRFTGFQGHMFWELIFLVKDPQAGESDVGLGPSASWGGPLPLWYLLLLVVCWSRLGESWPRRISYLCPSCQSCWSYFFFFFFFLCTQAYGGPQASGQIGAVAAGHSHSQVRSKLCLVTLPPLGAMPLLNPLSEAKDRTCILMDAGQICFCWATTETIRFLLSVFSCGNCFLLIFRLFSQTVVP